MDCQPRYATRRRPERQTFGPRLGKVAEMLGTPLMPWQQYVVDVGCELLPSPSGLLIPAYREVIVTVMRQNGKTTIVLALELDRALFWGSPQRIAYTAQTGKDAKDKVLDDQVPAIERSALAPAIAKVRRVNGSEGINFKGGSRLDVLASSESAGHGKTLDLGVVDEAFDDTDDRREQAMLPGMSTRKEAQLWVASTQGTDKSTYLNRKIDTGRDIALADSDQSNVAYFEWSIPDHEDVYDPKVWARYMPAYNRTVGEPAIRHAAATMTEGEFRRAFCNQRTSSDERVIPIDAWEAAADPFAKPEGRLVFAIDTTPERDWCSTAVADELGRIELVEHRESTGWLVQDTARRAKSIGARVAYDPSGPAGVFGEELRREGVPVIEVVGRELGHACSFFFDGVLDKRLHIRPHVALNAANAAARKKTNGDAWVWARRDSVTPICPLVASTLAAFAAGRAIDAAANVH